MSDDIGNVLLWRCAVLLAIILAITAYNIAYLYAVEPMVTPSYVWPTTPGSMN